ncbi:hypothetical protein [Streptomyces sp. AVP053U2]|uniref:hypothetical protein n=1 Tax=Streptomyces sp. AVP053U2 TaxID=1737066 RepID=UPI000B04348D|nr:hypothetical protein [Streptomyces sp. AVP053U2]
MTLTRRFLFVPGSARHDGNSALPARRTAARRVRDFGRAVPSGPRTVSARDVETLPGQRHERVLQ